LESAVSVESPAPVVNRLIDGLPRRERHRVLARAEPVDLSFGAILCEPDQRYPHVYFPLTGFISLVTTVDGHEPLEMGMIGNEGMLGVTMVLGIGAAPLRGVVQGAGTALRMTVPQLRRELRDCPGLLRALNRYLYVLMAQLTQTATCSRFHEVEARLARWLLMTHDRAHADHFHLTHQFLADMLGVRRSAVTIAAGALRKRKLIRYVRGEISILSRVGLEDASCECYEAVVDDYTRLLA
jgi:CRP-like cAMP-binding protein